MGAFAVGLGNGAFWSLAPLFATDGGLDFDGVAVFMSLVVLGGALGQYPLGKLSDRIDRRRVILGAAVGVALMGGMLPIAADMFAPGLYVGAFLFGLAAIDRKSTRLNSSPSCASRLPSSAWNKKITLLLVYN